MNKLNIAVGDRAPEFSLPDQDEKEVSLESLKGKRVLLSFHPLAWTGVCEIQMRTLELKHKAFQELNTVALGVSVDSSDSKKAWALSMGMKETRLIADFWPHGGMAKKYGLFLEESGISGRANILIDEEGSIAFIKIYELGEVPDIEEIIRFLAG
jgi:peroxiredoxin